MMAQNSASSYCSPPTTEAASSSSSSCSSCSSGLRAGLFEQDVAELLRKHVITSQKELELLSLFADESTRKEALHQLRGLYQLELHSIIDETRVELNRRQQHTLVQSDVLAIAAGGLFGAFNAWMCQSKPSLTKSNSARSSSFSSSNGSATIPATRCESSHSTSEVSSGISDGTNAKGSIWTSAFDAAQASLNVCRQRRLVEHLQLQYIGGDESKASHVLICVSGFMTQGLDPTSNWQVWFQGQEQHIVAYSLLWEAGDGDVWNHFCAHVNDKRDSESSSALIAHFTENPWLKAQDKAENVGNLLAHVLAHEPTFLKNRKVTLVGHSLGALVAVSALQELARLRDRQRQAMQNGTPLEAPVIMPVTKPLVTNVVFLAGAFVAEEKMLQQVVSELALAKQLDGRLVNVFSRRDGVLSKLFWVAKLHKTSQVAAGCSALELALEDTMSSEHAKAVQLINLDVSELVLPTINNQFGHTYTEIMASVHQRVLQHLRFQ